MTDDAPRPVRPSPSDDDPARGVFSLVLGCLGLIGVTAASVVAGPGPSRTLVAQLVVLVVAAWGAGAIDAVLLVAVAWGLLTGFVVNSRGELAFAASDLAHLGILVVGGGLAFATGRLFRRVVDLSDERRVPQSVATFGETRFARTRLVELRGGSWGVRRRGSAPGGGHLGVGGEDVEQRAAFAELAEDDRARW